MFPRGISIVLPAYNEGENIASTVMETIARMRGMARDFEVIVVNDGSKDNTRVVVEELTRYYPNLRLINHDVNKGCGAALVTGFEAASKEYSFYMDSDGQFNIEDMARLLPYVERYDGVFGYRVDRQDTWMRKLNAWGWNIIVRFFFRIPIRDVDCAFKIFRTEFFKTNKLEARGALLLTELIFKFYRAGYTFTQVPVRHFPRGGGKGTGAKPSVIVRAFYELFVYASKWSQDDQAA
jgi:glycosyltransferase involved in cell wall biosynthesis